MSDHLLYVKSGAIATVRFNRPEKKNALTSEMYAAACDALEDAARDESVRVAVFMGGEIFTAGNDIGDFMAAGMASGGNANDLPVVKFIHAMIAFPKPLLAAVRGSAIGIGSTLLMHCDTVVAGTSARFTMPFTKLGLVPEAASSLLFPLIVGRARASWHLLSGESFDAEAALDMGFVTRVVADGEVETMAGAMAATLAELPPNSVATTKRLIKAPFADAVDAAFAEELTAFTAALQSDEARSAFMAFMTKR